MEIVIALFFLTIVLLIVIPTLPESRRMRIVLAILAVPGILCAYGVWEKFFGFHESTIGPRRG